MSASEPQRDDPQPQAVTPSANNLLDSIFRKDGLMPPASITREKRPAMLQPQVIGQGAEIKVAVCETLFEPFIGTKTSASRVMGLTNARHTIRNLEGELQLKEQAGGGVTATLSHPL